jgi:CheY-like chemotaxis protein
MTLHVLLVEDDVGFVEDLKLVFGDLSYSFDLKVAGSRDRALALLREEFFDLVVLDLQIPTVDGALDAKPEHGHAVFAHAQESVPGTPIIVLTGSSADNFIGRMLEQQRKADIWGEGKSGGTIRFIRKFEFDEMPKQLCPIASAVEALDDVELNLGGINLSIQEDRLIRIFVRSVNGIRCIVQQLRGGLSGAKVVRLKVTDKFGARVYDAVAKLGQPKEVRDEDNRFRNWVTRLPSDATPRWLGTRDCGAGNLAGIFFALAAGHEFTAFDAAVGLVRTEHKVIGHIETAVAHWREDVPEQSMTIRDVRRRMLNDAALAEVRDLYDIDWSDSFENRKVQVRWGCIHGDMHGGNVLITREGKASLIDYGDVGPGPLSADPITLEFSLLFHPQHPDLKGWPSADRARQWSNLDAYLEGCLAAEFIRDCRSWAERVAGQREVAVSACSYLMRQLKYDDSDKDLALALFAGTRACLMKTFTQTFSG